MKMTFKKQIKINPHLEITQRKATVKQIKKEDTKCNRRPNFFIYKRKQLKTRLLNRNNGKENIRE